MNSANIYDDSFVFFQDVQEVKSKKEHRKKTEQLARVLLMKKM